MTAGAGTLERIALTVGKGLEPLAFRLNDDVVLETLARLGVAFPAALVTHPAITPARAATRQAAEGLRSKIDDLIQALESEDGVVIAAAAGALLAQIATTISAIRTLADALRTHGPSLPGVSAARVDALIAGLPRKLLDLVAVDALDERLPMLSALLTFAGVVERTPHPGDPADPTDPEYEAVAVHLEAISRIVADPAGHLRSLLGWGSPGFDGSALTSALDEAFGLLDFPSVLTPAGGGAMARLESLAFAVQTVPQGLDVTITQPVAADETTTAPFNERWSLTASASATLVPQLVLRLRPPSSVEVSPPAGTFTGRVEATLTGTSPDPILLFGALGATRLEAKTIDAGGKLEFAGGPASVQPSVVGHVRGGRLVISFVGGDGFLASVLPGQLQSDFDLGASWSVKTGLVLEGGAALRLILPLSADVGPARLEQLDLALGLDPARIFLELRLSGSVGLGPFAASVEGVGAAVDLAFRDGNLGPLDVSLRFLPPTGLGLTVDAGPVGGGGFVRYDPVNARYGGVLELRLGVVAIQAVALLDTRLPGGRSGYALLVLMRASFPPIQLGFGFALSSVGGLLALNRRVDVDALRDRMATGAAGRILAPEDPIRNAPVLLADLSAVFPPAEGIVVVGPTLQLSWVEIVRFDIGIFLELPGPRKVVILGSARAAIENPSGGKPYVQIRLDILGVIDFPAKTLAFDAVLIDSHLIEILQLSGGAAFRLSWGAEPYVVLTVGGFHPGYNPAPLVFPSSLTRIAMVRGRPDDFLYLRFEGYFAITTNTLQFGAAVEVRINLGPFNIRGFLGFDALIQFEPLRFQFAIAASVKVRWKSHNLGGLSLRGELSGPGPVIFRGKVCFEILWFDICFEETFRLGSSSPPAVTPVASAVAELTSELDDVRNIRAVEGVDRSVATEPAKNSSLPVVSPLGQAIWSQQRAPLGLLLQRFEGAPLSRPETVTISGPQVTAPEEDWFAPGSFSVLADADALNRPAFSRLVAGARLGLSGTDDGPSKDKLVTVRQIRLPMPSILLTAVAFPGWMLRAVAGRLGAQERDPVSPTFAVRNEEWALHSGGAVTTGLSQPQAHQLAKVGTAGTAVAAVDVVPAIGF
ncbi:DUF6603 domain-containing protein [Lysobacter korlensis]|uniref:DUF6603 domain-containing protein n=1 Tax=Lysobacter korlensis TaxID=553636 RepID=A0ABV6RM55_9GAMM